MFSLSILVMFYNDFLSPSTCHLHVFSINACSAYLMGLLRDDLRTTKLPIPLHQLCSGNCKSKCGYYYPVFKSKYIQYIHVEFFSKYKQWKEGLTYCNDGMLTVVSREYRNLMITGNFLA